MEKQVLMAKQLGEQLLAKGKTVSFAESCTGGYLSHLVTAVSGSSAYFKGSVVSYSNEAKQAILGVEEASLNRFGAVSEEVVIQMASNARQMFRTDFAIAVSGVAGPTGDTTEKPVGTVWMALATPTETVAYRFLFDTADGRIGVIRQTAGRAIELLMDVLTQIA